MQTGGKFWTALAAANVAGVICGTTALFGKLDVSPIWIVAGRGIFAAATVLLFALASRAVFRLAAGDALKVAGTAALLTVHWVTFFVSVQAAGVAVATLTFATFPLMTLVFESLARRRRPSLIESAASLVIVGAVWMLVGEGLPATVDAQLGAVAGLMSAVSFAGFSVGSQRLGRRVNNFVLSFYQNAGVFLLLLPLLPFTDRAPALMDWPFIIALGVGATALMHQLYFYSLKWLPAAVCGGFVALEPVYAIVFAAILFAEPITVTVLVSGAMIVGASILLLRFSENREALGKEAVGP